MTIQGNPTKIETVAIASYLATSFFILMLLWTIFHASTCNVYPDSVVSTATISWCIQTKLTYVLTKYHQVSR